MAKQEFEAAADMTELSGSYQIALDLSMADILKAGTGDERWAMCAVPPGTLLGRNRGVAGRCGIHPLSSSIFSTVQQLGLKLEPRKAPIETIVIDHLEKAPTEN
jgi:uncharacterized protein (TIGR03435 family)